MLKLIVRVPRYGVPEDVLFSILYTPPIGIDNSYRELRQASQSFTYYAPLPEVHKSDWCKVCPPGQRTCIVNGRCGDGSVPSASKCPISGGGVLTVVVDNLPHISFKQTTGALQSQGEVISLSLGSAGFGTFRRVAYSIGERAAYEFVMPSMQSAGPVMTRISVQGADQAVASSAVFGLEYFDETIDMSCDPSEGSASSGSTISLTARRFPFLAQVAASDQIDVLFGGVAAFAVSLDYINGTEMLLSVVTPPYDCQMCLEFRDAACTRSASTRR